MVYDEQMFQELTYDEMMKVDGGAIFTIILGGGYALIKTVGGATIAKFVGTSAAAAAIAWCVNKGLDFIFG